MLIFFVSLQEETNVIGVSDENTRQTIGCSSMVLIIWAPLKIHFSVNM
jgi:hypothetical protein